MKYYVFNILYFIIQKMGVIYSILELGLHRNPRYLPELIVPEKPQLYGTPLEKWLKSEKHTYHLEQFLKNVPDTTWMPQIISLLRQIRQRQRYQSYIEVVLAFLREKQCINEQSILKRNQVYTHFRQKLATSCFINEDFNDRAVEECQLSNMEKIIEFLDKISHLSKIGSGSNYADKVIALNFPYFFDSLEQFTKQALEHYIIIDSNNNIDLLILSEQKLNKISEKIENQLQYFQNEQAEIWRNSLKSLFQKGPKNLYMKMSQHFLEIGNNPTAAETIIQIMKAKKYNFTYHQCIMLLYIKLYAIFLYNEGQLHLQYSQFINQSIEEIIHKFLVEHRIEQLETILLAFHESFADFQLENFQTAKHNQKNIFLTFHYRNAEQLFQKYILNYIFSQNATYSTCIKILQKMEVHPSNQQQALLIQNKYIEKLMKTGLEVCQMKQLHKTIFKKLKISEENCRIILNSFEIGETFVFFSMNLKIQSIANFLNGKYSKLQAQEHGLAILKNFISKFYITDRKKKIRIPIQTQYQIIDLFKPEAIFKIITYLKKKIFTQLNGQQITQIIIQHMLYFYRYEELSYLVGKEQIWQEYEIIYEVAEVIIVDNIMQSLQKQQLQKINNDIRIQLRILKEGEEKYIAEAYYNLLKSLEGFQIHLSEEQKKSMIKIDLLYWMIRQFPQKIEIFNYSNLYSYICIVRDHQVRVNQSQNLLSNQYMHFQIQLAKQAFKHQFNSFAIDIIKQLSRYQPPWLSQQLLKIAQTTPNALPENFLVMAFEMCNKGESLETVIKLWKSHKQKQKISKQKKIFDAAKNFTKHFETCKKYTVLGDDLISDENQYRNHVAEMIFTEEKLKGQDYELFFTLLGTEPQRAFFYAIKDDLDTTKIDIFIIQGIKSGIIKMVPIIIHYLKYLYFRFIQYCKSQDVELKLRNDHQIYPTFRNYNHFSKKSMIENIQSIIQQYSKQSNISGTYYYLLLSKQYRSFETVEKLGINFMNLYVSENDHYKFLYEDNYRKVFLTGLKDQNMAKNDVMNLYQFCKKILNFDVMGAYILNLTNKLNSSDPQLTPQIQSILLKFIIWCQGNTELAHHILSQLCQKIHSAGSLALVIEFLRDNDPDNLAKIITNRHFQILSSLAAIEIDRELYGIVPSNFFTLEIGYKPRWPISEKHWKILDRVAKRSNVFVLAKIMSFLYGLNKEIQKQILLKFINDNDQQSSLQQLRQKLGC